MTHIIDRRLNPKGKSLGNRQKFLRRAKEQIKDAVKRTIQERGIADIQSGEKISIPAKGVKEPKFRQSAKGGFRERVLPGNQEYLRGDQITKPQQGQGGRGSKAGDGGEGEDDFQFTLSRNEFLDIFFEDLELPDLVKQKLKQTTSVKYQRAGFTNVGSPSSLSVIQTMRHALARRLALGRPKDEAVRELQVEIFALEGKTDRTAEESQRLSDLHGEMATRLKRQKAIPYIDPVDVRYHQFQAVPQPSTQAVMFCLMDVSGSMGEREKDLAKRFFMLLYLFLQRRYENIELVFIRHTHEAEEVDEHTFFYDRRSGGTIVSTALEEMQRVIKQRYPTDDWNIYCAQASDGDNWTGDSQKCHDLLVEQIMPLLQYYAYIEISQPRQTEYMFGSAPQGDLWKAYEKVSSACGHFAQKKIMKPADIFPVFRELFARQAN